MRSQLFKLAAKRRFKTAKRISREGNKMQRRPRKLIVNSGAYKLTIPKELIESALKWNKETKLVFEVADGKLIIEQVKD